MADTQAKAKEKVNLLKFTASVGGKDVALIVRRPSPRDDEEANLHGCQTMAQCVNKKLLLRAEVEQLCKDRGLWGDSQQQKSDLLVQEITQGELALRKKTGLTKAQARELAVSVQEKRAERNALRASLGQLDRETAEAQVEDARFRYLVFACTIDEQKGRRYWPAFDHFLAAQEKDEEVTKKAADHLTKLLYNFDEDWWFKLPENAFLLEHKFMDRQGRFLDGEGNFVTKDGRKVDGEGYLMNEDGQRVDRFGNLIDDKGEFLVVEGRFDDDPPAQPALPAVILPTNEELAA